MLRLNRMTDYAIVVLGALAHRHGDVLATAHLAELTGLAQPTVAKVSKILLAADLVETQRGVRGGPQIQRQGTGDGVHFVDEDVSRCLIPEQINTNNASESGDLSHRGG